LQQKYTECNLSPNQWWWKELKSDCSDCRHWMEGVSTTKLGTDYRVVFFNT